MISAPTSRYWLARLYLTLIVMALTFVTSFEPRTMVYTIIRASGEEGIWCVTFLGLVATVGLLDTIVNDLLPEQYHFRWAKRRRHVIYMGIAIGLVSMAFLVARHAGPSPVHLTLGVSAAVSVAIAFFDMFARHGE